MTMMAGDRGPFATREDVRDMGHAIQVQIDRRFVEQRERGDERHADNLERFDALLSKADRADERLTKLEVITKNLQEEFQAIRKRWHDFRDSITSKITGPQGPQGLQGDRGESGENRRITKWDVIIFAAGGGMFYALAKLMKWIP